MNPPTLFFKPSALLAHISAWGLRPLKVPHFFIPPFYSPLNKGGLGGSNTQNKK